MGSIKYENNAIYVQHGGRWQVVAYVKNRVITIFRDHDRHLFGRFDSYGFSKTLMEMSAYFDYVLLKEKYLDHHGKPLFNIYFIPREDIISKGIPHRQEGLEEQILISLAKLEDYKQREAL